MRVSVSRVVWGVDSIEILLSRARARRSGSSLKFAG
jgi:hypothetical protein